MIASQDFFVGIQDVGEGNLITNKAILEALTNVTNLHGHMVGQSMDDEAYRHLEWMVLRWKLQVFKRCRVCETITARTWVIDYLRNLTNRDYDILDSNGEVCAVATAVWGAADPEKGVMRRLTPELMEVYGPEPDEHRLYGYKYINVRSLDLGEPVGVTEFRTAKSMVDCNNHVHNPAYLDFAMEALPHGLDTKHYDDVEIAYRREVKPESVVRIEHYEYEDEQIILVKSQDGKTLHASIILK
ncbi:MAG: acyl-ACP thioesterase domain-containing protein [Coriobacteriales bacterium]